MVDQTLPKNTAAEFAELPEPNTPVELSHGEVIVAPLPIDKYQSRSLNCVMLNVDMLLKD